MIKCLYCETKFITGKGSLEHVILSSLGGRKGSRNVCCEECNSRLGSEIDKSISEAFSFFSNMLGIRTGRNKQAAVLKNVIKIGENSYNMLPEGKLELSKNKVNIKEFDNRKEVTINAKNEEEAKNILKKIMFDQLKLDPTSVKNIQSTINKIYPPTIQNNFSFGGDEQYRSIAKTILTYLATLVKPERLRDNTFKDIINYINGVSNNIKFPVLYNGKLKLPETHKLSEINHRVFICASSTKNKVIGILEIYGCITISCILSKKWIYNDISKVYIVDPVTSKTLNEDILLSESLINECINMNVSLDDESIVYIKDDISKLMREIVKRQKNSRIEEKIKEAMNMYLPNEGEVITDESIYKLSHHLATEITDDIYKINRKDEYELNFENL